MLASCRPPLSPCKGSSSAVRTKAARYARGCCASSSRWVRLRVANGALPMPGSKAPNSRPGSMRPAASPGLFPSSASTSKRCRSRGYRLRTRARTSPMLQATVGSCWRSSTLAANCVRSRGRSKARVLSSSPGNATLIASRAAALATTPAPSCTSRSLRPISRSLPKPISRFRSSAACRGSTAMFSSFARSAARRPALARSSSSRGA